MKKIIIAIDGFSSTGKSTIAKKVAQQLGYVYVDTGAMYRAVTYLALSDNLCCATSVFDSTTQTFQTYEAVDEEVLVNRLKNSEIQFQFNRELGFSEIYLNGKNIEKEIRGIEVANRVSIVAKIPQVRRYLVNLQQKMGENKGVVMDGRDIGTIVFPDAELKIFMTASEQIRAERRYKELISKGEEVSFENVLQNIRQRDYLDTNREESPLRKADDAIVLDNSNATIDDLTHQIVQMALDKISMLK